MASDYGSLGNIKMQQGELKEAEKLYNKSLEIDKELGRKEGIAATFINLGSIKEKLGELEEAEKLYKKALKIYETYAHTENVNELKQLIEQLEDEKK